TRRKRGIELFRVCRCALLQPDAKRLRQNRGGSKARLVPRIGMAPQHPDLACLRDQLMEQLEAFAVEFAADHAEACDIAAGSPERLDEARFFEVRGGNQDRKSVV